MRAAAVLFLLPRESAATNPHVDKKGKGHTRDASGIQAWGQLSEKVRPPDLVTFSKLVEVESRKSH